MSNTKTNDYCDIIVTSTISERIFRKDENDECNPKEEVIKTKKKYPEV